MNLVEIYSEQQIIRFKLKMMNTLNKIKYPLMLAMAVLAFSCNEDEDVPPEENEEEVITDVTLVFTDTTDSTNVVRARAQDPDGAGSAELAILDIVSLDANTTYELTFEIFNNLETPGEDIGDEIKEEDDEHQIFFSFTDGAFITPNGTGNIVRTSQSTIIDNDVDENGTPAGLSTHWTTGASALSSSTGLFKVQLQHQPGIKTATSTADDGETDFELEFVLEISGQAIAIPSNP